jgi:hypothetical protein
VGGSVRVLSMSNVIAALAVVFAALAWWSAVRSRKAAEREATAAEASNELAKRADRTATAANKLSAESNAIARQAAQETQAMYQLQAHEQSRPELTLEVGALPSGEGLLEVKLWSNTTFDSGTLSLAREFMPHPFAGFMAGPDQPEQIEITPSTELPATTAGEAVIRHLFVRDSKALERAEIRLICELKIADRSTWQYVHIHNFYWS